MKIKYLLLFFCSFGITIRAFSQTTTLIPDDYTYNPAIKTVMLYPTVGDVNDAGKTLNSAVTQVGSSEKLVLEFDDLAGEFQQYHIKIFPYTSDWQVQNLADIEFLADYNDLIINDYQISQGTKTTYYHYRIALPAVKLAGNYLVAVYRQPSRTERRPGERSSNNFNPENLMLSKRFLAYDNRINCGAKISYAQDPAKRRAYQQIDLGVNYGNYPIISPKEDLKIIVRQNYRWNKTIQLHPTSVDEFNQKVEFQYFNNENLMPAGNEFRFFENRNSMSRGLFIKNIIHDKVDEVYIFPSENRSESSYIQTTDFNGMYIVDNIDAVNDETGADYNYITLGLKSHELEGDKKVFMNGAFNNWHLDNANEMKYDNEFGGYVIRILLKQGIYNYDFVVQDSQAKTLDEEYFEGNFADTNNAYEVIIYHKPFGARAEQIVGYKLIEFNKR